VVDAKQKVYIYTVVYFALLRHKSTDRIKTQRKIMVKQNSEKERRKTTKHNTIETATAE